MVALGTLARPGPLCEAGFECAQGHAQGRFAAVDARTGQSFEAVAAQRLVAPDRKARGQSRVQPLAAHHQGRPRARLARLVRDVHPPGPYSGRDGRARRREKGQPRRRPRRALRQPRARRAVAGVFEVARRCAVSAALRGAARASGAFGGPHLQTPPPRRRAPRPEQVARVFGRREAAFCALWARRFSRVGDGAEDGPPPRGKGFRDFPAQHAYCARLFRTAPARRHDRAPNHAAPRRPRGGLDAAVRVWEAQKRRFGAPRSRVGIFAAPRGGLRPRRCEPQAALPFARLAPVAGAGGPASATLRRGGPKAVAHGHGLRAPARVFKVGALRHRRGLQRALFPARRRGAAVVRGDGAVSSRFCKVARKLGGRRAVRVVRGGGAGRRAAGRHALRGDLRRYRGGVRRRPGAPRHRRVAAGKGHRRVPQVARRHAAPPRRQAAAPRPRGGARRAARGGVRPLGLRRPQVKAGRDAALEKGPAPRPAARLAALVDAGGSRSGAAVAPARRPGTRTSPRQPRKRVADTTNINIEEEASCITSARPSLPGRNLNHAPFFHHLPLEFILR
mmetsp:Transcript_27229/g.93592  ORF Transcript_27229/g.93592 Transcript_27229/m.93592 type:complete len:563 (-) Transcript_27229:27-1715(-)